MKLYRLDVFVPDSHLELLKESLFAAGAGHFAAYDHCCWQTSGTGQFRPLEGAKPFLGETGRIEYVTEWKLEMIVESSRMEAVLSALKRAHPYETPAYQYWPVNDEPL